MTNPFAPGPQSPLPPALPDTTDMPAPKKWVTVVGWVLLVLGVLVVFGSVVEWDGAGGLLLGISMAFVGAVLIWRFVNWKLGTPIAVVLFVVGGILLPTPPKDEPAKEVTQLVGTSSAPSSTSTKPPTSTKPTSTKPPISTSSIPSTTPSSTPSSTSVRVQQAPRTTTPAWTSTYTPPPETVSPPADTYVPPANTYVPPVNTPNRGSNGRTGAICKDGTTDTRTGRGACSGHHGVRNWLD